MNPKYQSENFYSTAPYEVITERADGEEFGKFSSVWVKPLLVAPGPVTYFVYYKFDKESSVTA